MCRSRRELSNAYLLAKIGVDTAENEPLEVWEENSIHYSLHSLVITLDGRILDGQIFKTQLEAERGLARLGRHERRSWKGHAFHRREAHWL